MTDRAAARLRAGLHTGRTAARGVYASLAELGLARMTPPRGHRDAALRLAASLRAVGDAHGLRVTVRGEVPREVTLLASNHVSYLDPLVILPVCPAMPLAKAEVARWPLIGPIGRALGVTFVDRDDPASRIRALRRLHATLSAGTSVLNFPEGTTTPGDSLRPFWRGGFGVVARLGLPVTPLAIRYLDPAMAWTGGQTFLPHYLRMASRPHVDVELAFGSALYPRAGEPAERLAARARAAVGRLLAEGRPLVSTSAVVHPGSSHAAVRVRVPPPRPDSVLPAA